MARAEVPPLSRPERKKSGSSRSGGRRKHSSRQWSGEQSRTRGREDGEGGSLYSWSCFRFRFRVLQCGKETRIQLEL